MYMFYMLTKDLLNYKETKYVVNVVYLLGSGSLRRFRNRFSKILGFISIFPISLNETTPYISNLYIFDNLRLQYSEVMFHVSCWKTELLTGPDWGYHQSLIFTNR